MKGELIWNDPWHIIKKDFSKSWKIGKLNNLSFLNNLSIITYTFALHANLRKLICDLV